MAVVIAGPRRDEVWLVDLEPTQGSEMKKTRPCLIISPDVMNQHLRTVILAPMTTKIRTYPTRISLTFGNKRGQVALDQLRAVDQARLRRRLGKLSDKVAETVADTLVEMFERE